MNLPKPKPFQLKEQFKFNIGCVTLDISVDLYGCNKYIVVEHSFLGLQQEIAIFNDFETAIQACHEWDVETDVYTSYSIKKITLP